MPGVPARAHRGSERLAVRVGPGQAAEIRPFPHPNAGNEESHRVLLRHILLRERQVRPGKYRHYEMPQQRIGSYSSDSPWGRTV